ncbi:MAG TPA: hypothetical protein VFN35_18415 [Ktedonobacteraceae bacterium]|nr:hypothetical protein [Ktedonobacteraceae bacterium]
MRKLKRMGVTAVMSLTLALSLIATGASAQSVKTDQSSSARSAVTTTISQVNTQALSAANTQHTTQQLGWWRGSWGGSWGGYWGGGCCWDDCGCGCW